MDAFFAAVEVLDNPELVGRPVIVGGSGNRGVVASCTYEARAFGVRSAMPSTRARRLCPDAVFVPGRYARYAELSRLIQGRFLDVTPLVEPIGLDEAFLDVTGARRLLGPPVDIAVRLRERIRQELSLACSIGIGRTKMVAKLASRAAKPRPAHRGPRPGPGVVVVEADEELAFLHPHPVESLWGVGPATAKRLHDLGVRTVGDLAALPPGTLVRRLGRAQGAHLLALAHAQDPSPVVPDRAAKSLSHEETFATDLTDPAQVAGHVTRMAESVASQIRAQGLQGRTVQLKVKYADFTLITRSHTLAVGLDTAAAVGAVARALAEGVDLSPGVRLLGVGLSGLGAEPAVEQMALPLADDPAVAGGEVAAGLQASWAEVTAAVDAVRARYGSTAVGSAAMLGRDGLHVPGRRQAPWGPDDDQGAPA
jgi:DNA polymerase-4